MLKTRDLIAIVRAKYPEESRSRMGVSRLCGIALRAQCLWAGREGDPERRNLLSAPWVSDDRGRLMPMDLLDAIVSFSVEKSVETLFGRAVVLEDLSGEERACVERAAEDVLAMDYRTLTEEFRGDGVRRN